MSTAIRGSSLVIVLCLVGLLAETVRAQTERVLTYGTSQETMLFDPAKHVDETQSINVINTYDPLVRPIRIGSRLVVQPWLARYWVTSDAQTWTLKLRQGVTFHDGSEMTAEDVAFSMDRMLQIGQGFSGLWKGLIEPGDTVATDRYTVDFKLRKPFALFIPTLVQFHIVNKALCLSHEKDGDLCQEYLLSHDAGSGAYQVEQVQLGREIVFKHFATYFLGPAQITKVVWKVIPVRATLVAALQADTIDAVDQWLAPEVYRSLEEASGIVVYRDPQLQLYLHQMNTKKPPFDDVHCRRAVLFAFDYEAAVHAIFRGGTQAIGPVPVLAPGWNPALQPYKRDLETAKKELAQCKYAPADLRNMDLTYLFVAGDAIEERLGVLMHDSLKNIGLQVNLESLPWGQLTETAKTPETTHHFTAIFHTMKIPHPDSHTTLMFAPESRGGGGSYLNMNWYENAQATALMAQARTTVDEAEQFRLYAKVQEIVNAEAASLFIANPEHRIAFRDRVKGYTFNGVLGYDLFFWQLRIER